MSEYDDVERVYRTKAEAQSSYDRMSRWYEWLARSEKKYREAGLRLLNPIPGETLLEIGPGTGQSLIAAARMIGNNGRIVGIDLSLGMLRVAQKRLWRANLQDRCSLACGDGLTLPLGTNSVDGVFICFTLELFDTPELPLVLAEIRRVLGDNGRLCVVSLSKEEAGTAVRLYEWFHNKIPRYIDCRPIYCHRLLAAYGFQTRSVCQEKMWGLPVEIVLAV
ncbi:MAG: methyltransferase domain-containing protein [Chloroflexi bacterium]|nr:methyltransferase domain-containing protein [Chloroflexota bacterium]